MNWMARPRYNRTKRAHKKRTLHSQIFLGVKIYKLEVIVFFFSKDKLGEIESHNALFSNEDNA